MKKKTKVLLTLLCAILLITAAVGGTLAYLSHRTETDRNVFMVGNVDIYIDELKGDGPERTNEGNEYVLKAGATYHKDPIIHVAKTSGSSYIFAKVENQIAHLEKKDFSVSNQIIDNGWKVLSKETRGNTTVYWKKWNKPKSKKNQSYYDLQLFKTVNIDKKNSEESLKEAADKQIVITAYAVQQKSIADEEAAWNIIDGQFN